MTADPEPIPYVRRDGMSLVVDARSPEHLPRILHWGADLGPMTPSQLAALAEASSPLDGLGLSAHVPAGVLAEHALGGPETPGILGSRGGRDWSPRFVPTGSDRRREDGSDVLEFRAADAGSGLELTLVVEVTESGLVRTRSRLVNVAPDSSYSVEAVTAGLPVPAHAVDLLDFTGRHGLERQPVRQPFAPGLRVRESRQGRPGHDAAFLTIAGAAGFGFRDGEVWSAHLAWSGDSRVIAERLATGVSRLGGGELLWPGEVVLAPGESYQTPWLFGSYGRGLDEMAARYHGWLRSRPHLAGRARPLTLNSWEAIYFELDEPTLLELADSASALGAQRFVVDDGWFGARTDATSSLGDWQVEARRWPRGLHPIADRVHELGMEFGLWFEPEMVSPDSELARAHPDWILGLDGRRPLLMRDQLVLDLAHPAAYAHVRDRMTSLIREYRVDYLKWDHNRPLVDAGHARDGRPAAREQVLAMYRLHDELRRAFPGLAIEGCASGGGRIDLELATRVDRFWPSDTTDPLERQAIQRWTQLLIPPEMLGSHIARPVSPTTWRSSTLAFRAGTALFGDLGIEWDVRTAAADELDELAEWIRFSQSRRELIASGTVVRSDHHDPSVWVHGVVAPRRDHALLATVALRSGRTSAPGLARIPGLDPATVYAVADVTPGPAPATHLPLPAWMGRETRLSGAILATIGLELAALQPEQLRLLEFRAVES